MHLNPESLKTVSSTTKQHPHPLPPLFVTVGPFFDTSQNWHKLEINSK